MRFVHALFILFALVACSDGSGDGSDPAVGNEETRDGENETEREEEEPEPEPLPASALEILRQDPQYSTITELIETHNVGEALKSDVKITFFAPTNEAFEKIPDWALEDYQEDAAKFRYLLDSLIVEQELDSKKLYELETLTTKQNTVVSVERANGYLWIEGKPIMKSDGQWQGGFVHGLGGVVGYQ